MILSLNIYRLFKDKTGKNVNFEQIEESSSINYNNVPTVNLMKILYSNYCY